MLVSRYDLLVVKHLGHGMNRGVMDLERPFQGYYVPPKLQHNIANSPSVLESQSEADPDVILETKNELLPLE